MAKILLVNDDSSVCEAFCAVVRTTLPHEVIVGGASDRAVQLLPKVNPDLVITDLHNPPLGGLKVVEAVKKHNPAIPVLIVSAAPSELVGSDVIEKALALGACGHLRVPFQIGELLSSVEKALNNERME